MIITIELIENKNLSKKQKEIINKARIKEWGIEEKKDFNKDYEPNTIWIFVKEGSKIVSFGGLRPIKINYLGKKYDILGICSTISLEKGKGYGKIMVAGMLSYFKKTKKSALGFTSKTGFFQKAGLGIKRNFIRRFVYVNPKTKEKIFDSKGDGIFYNGEDNFINKILSTKLIVKIPIIHW